MKFSEFSILSFITILLIFLAFKVYKNNQEKTEIKEKVIYNFIPRTFIQEQNDPILPSVIFKDYFNSDQIYSGILN